MFFLTLGAFLLFWFFDPVSQIQASQQGIMSPLPQFLNMKKNDQVTSLTYWLPGEIPSATNSTISDLSATSALSYDVTSDKFLFVKNIQQHVPMASLTKIMTAIIGLEHPKADNQYLVDQRDLVGEDSVGLESGEKLSLEELLYGLFLHSGNDAAEVIANNAADGRAGFIADMNDKIKTMGLTDTHFTNPTGLEGDGNQYTTAYDLLVMTHYGLQFPLFQKTSSTVSITIPQTTTHKEYDLENETNLLTTYPGVDGIKTGYTPEAGYCLVTDLHYNDHHIIAIVLGSQDRRKDMKNILDYSLNSLGITPPPHD
jgi:D-alanyl-D-alanine carboxypeptidase